MLGATSLLPSGSGAKVLERGPARGLHQEAGTWHDALHKLGFRFFFFFAFGKEFNYLEQNSPHLSGENGPMFSGQRTPHSKYFLLKMEHLKSNGHTSLF